MDSVIKLTKYLPRVDSKGNNRLAVQLVSVAAVSSILYATYKSVSDDNKKRQITSKEIPTPNSSYPYFGHMLSLGDSPWNTITQWHQELGPIIKLKMGAQTWIIVDDPALAHKIFVSNGAETSYRPKMVFPYKLSSMGGKGLVFSQPGAGLKENRTAALTVLAPRMIVDHYMGSIKHESVKLISRLMEDSKAEGGVDPIKSLELNSLNVIFSACFGKKYDSVNDPEFVAVSRLIEKGIKLAGVENDLATFLPAFSFVDYLAGSQVKMREFLDVEREPIMRGLVREAALREGPNVIKSLQEEAFQFTEDEVMILAIDLVGAGTDTISITLLWIFAILCHHPDVQEKAAREIDDFIASNQRTPDFTERTQVPYCISVIKECMRLRPTTPFGVPHAVVKDVEVNGYIIPGGSTVMVNMLSMHRQAHIYPDPEVFKPERFMNNLKTMQSAANGKLEERDHFNFGFGRRVCPGIYLAECELFYAFMQVFSRATIEPAGKMPDIDSSRNGGLTIPPLHYKVKFVKRESSLI
ncbi:unnamed protein product [Mucor hiemalis]